MPMSQHRPALAAILVAVVAVLLLPAAPAAAAPPTPSPSQGTAIAQAALAYDGTYQGECWGFVKKVVAQATGRQIGFDYRQGFFDAGAIEVSITDAAAGDVIQIANDADSGPNADYAGLHTSIVLSANTDGTFRIIDSNMNFDGIVHIRDNYSPRDAAARYTGLTFHVYRFTGTAPAPGSSTNGTPGSTSRGGSSTVVPVDVSTVAAGDVLYVNTPADVLRLRAAPGGSILTVLADRTKVTVLSVDGLTNGYHWAKVSSPAGEGYVAIEFLGRLTAPAAPSAPSTPASSGAASAPAATSGSRTVNPVRPFRSFVPAVTSDD